MVDSDNTAQTPETAQSASDSISDRAEAELAQTQSAWKDIDSVITYDAEQTVGQETTPQRVESTSYKAPDLTTTDQLAPDASAPVGAVSGVTMSGRASNLMKILMRAVGIMLLAGAGWYIYTTYISS